MTTTTLRAPMPYFGGKASAAPLIWSAFGDVRHYIEPFCGSAAVLLAAATPPPIVTLNDKDGYLVNAYRAIQAAPDAVAQWAAWPVTEIDLFARHVWLVQRRETLRAMLEADPLAYDAQAAGWWLWGASSWIGDGWCSGDGPWWLDDGTLVRCNAGQGVNRQLPHLGPVRGVNRKLLHLGDAQGVTRRGDRGNLAAYMRRLSAALATARIACGDWSRVVTPTLLHVGRTAGVLLDPPYGDGAMEYGAGGNADTTLAAAVWQWAVTHGGDRALRIVVCGYDDGRALPPGWTTQRWQPPSGYRNQAGERRRADEVLWCSPHCHVAQPDLFDALEVTR